MFGIKWFDRMTPEKKAITEAAMHLRMVQAGYTSYSASPTRIDKGVAELIMERLDAEGFRIVPAVAQGIPLRENAAGG